MNNWVVCWVWVLFFTLAPTMVSADTIRQSFTPSSNRVPIESIVLSSAINANTNQPDGLIFSLFECKNTPCIFDLVDTFRLENIDPNPIKAIPIGVYNYVTVNHCFNDEVRFIASIRGSFITPSGNEYITRETDVLIRQPASLPEHDISVPFNRCQRTVELAQPLMIQDSKKADISLVLQHANSAFGFVDGVRFKNNGCIENTSLDAATSTGVCLNYPTMVPIPSKQLPTVETYYLTFQNMQTGAIPDVASSSPNAMLTLFTNGTNPNSHIYGGMIRWYFQKHTKHVGIAYIDDYGELDGSLTEIQQTGSTVSFKIAGKKVTEHFLSFENFERFSQSSTQEMTGEYTVKTNQFIPNTVRFRAER